MQVTERSFDPSKPGDFEEWDAFVTAHAEGTLFHTTHWAAAIRAFFPHRARWLEVRDGGALVGVLPLFETRSPLSGRALISVPYAVYGGPLTTRDGAEEALVEHVRAMVRDGGLRCAELRCRMPLSVDLPGTELYQTFRKELPSDPEECLTTIPRKSRATARQARDRHGLELREAPDHVAEFHRLFVLNKQRLGSPSFSRRWFEHLLGLPDRRVRLHAVFQGETPLMAVVSFVGHGDFNPYYSGSVAEADRMGASNFAYWQLMRIAAEEGLRTFDFGRSRAETGAAKFKRNMGFEAAPLHYRYVLGEGQSIPEVNPGNPAFSLPRKIIQRMPRAIVERVGPWMMRAVP